MRARNIFIVGSILLCVGIAFGLVAIIMYSSSENFKKGAIKTTAEVESINNNKVVVKYDVKGEQIKNELDTYNSSLYKGKQIDIYYKENNPNKIMDNTRDIFVIVFAIVAGILFLVGLFVDMFAVDKRRKNRIKSEA